MQDLLFDFIAQYIELDETEKKAISDLDIFRNVAKGEVLLSEGQYSNEGYFVLKGCLRMYYIVEGEEKTTAFYTEMEGITPECVSTQSKSTYFLSAVEDSIISTATPDMEQQIFESFPKFESLCRVISEELLIKQQINFDQFKLSSPEERYLSLLENRPDLIQRVPQHQLASFLGITPQSLSRMKSRIYAKIKKK